MTKPRARTQWDLKALANALPFARDADPVALALAVPFGTVAAVVWVDGAALTAATAVIVSALLGATGILVRYLVRRAERRSPRLGDYALVMLASVLVAGPTFGATMAFLDGDRTGPLESLWRGSLFGVALGASWMWELHRAPGRPARDA